MAGDVKDIQINVTANTTQAKQALDQLKGATDGASTAMDKKAKSTVNAGGAVISFGRIIQDAPFGIIGVANNITMLSEQFVSLKQQTGSTTAALQAMKVGIMGPLGLTIAISAITTAMQFWALSSQKTKNAAVSSNDAIKSSLQQVHKAMLETVKSEESKIVVLRSLNGVLQSTTANLSQKKNALNEIQKIYPDYLKGINLDNISQNDLNARIEKGNILIAKRAELMAYESKLRKAYETKLDVETQIFGSTPNAEDYGNAAQSMGYGRLGLDAAMWMKFKSNPNYQALYNARARLSMIQRLNKTLLKPIEDIIDNTSKTMASLSSDVALTPDSVMTPGITTDSKTNQFKEKTQVIKSYLDALREEIEITLEIDNLTGKKTSQLVYGNYLNLIAQEISSNKLSQTELLGLLRLRKEVMKEMEEDYPAGTYTRTAGFDYFGGFDKGTMKGMKKAADANAKEKLKQDMIQAKAQFKQYEEFFIIPFADAFKGEFSKAWNSIFGEANSLLEKFMQSLAEKLFNQGIEKAAFGLMDLIFPGSGALAQAVTGGGGDRPINIIVDGETIATQKQANRTMAIINRGDSLK